MSKLADVVVVGGGAIGLSLAYELARRGVKVKVFDVGPFGRGSSWAGAGILAPWCARPPHDPLEALRDLSVRLHVQWAEELRERTGIDTGYCRSGGVEVAFTESEVAELVRLHALWGNAGIACENLTAADRLHLEPALSQELAAAVFLPDKAQLRNPWHIRALVAANQALGVQLFPECPVESFEVQAGRLAAVRTQVGAFACGQAVVCAGAWSEKILESVGVPISTPPVKGQIVLLNAGGLAPHRIIEHGSLYLVPRVDGRVLVGSTEEHVGFDTRPTLAARTDLQAEAIRLCPALEDAPVETAWAGLRPGSMDTLPYIGAVPGYRGLHVATGHFRAGLQLSPGTAVVMADLLTGRTPAVPTGPFGVERTPRVEPPLFRS